MGSARPTVDYKPISAACVGIEVLPIRSKETTKNTLTCALFKTEGIHSNMLLSDRAIQSWSLWPPIQLLGIGAPRSCKNCKQTGSELRCLGSCSRARYLSLDMTSDRLNAAG